MIMRALVLVLLAGCYHYSFEQHPTTQPTVTYKVRSPTYLNGFVDTGRVDTRALCAQPVRTELRVTATDVLLSAVTLLIYTPHTLYVTCPVTEARQASR